MLEIGQFRASNDITGRNIFGTFVPHGLISVECIASFPKDIFSVLLKQILRYTVSPKTWHLEKSFGSVFRLDILYLNWFQTDFLVLACVHFFHSVLLLSCVIWLFEEVGAEVRWLSQASRYQSHQSFGNARQTREISQPECRRSIFPGGNSANIAGRDFFSRLSTSLVSTSFLSEFTGQLLSLLWQNHKRLPNATLSCKNGVGPWKKKTHFILKRQSLLCSFQNQNWRFISCWGGKIREIHRHPWNETASQLLA